MGESEDSLHTDAISTRINKTRSMPKLTVLEDMSPKLMDELTSTCKLFVITRNTHATAVVDKT